MKVLAISGSLRAGSYNTALARAAAELAPDGIEIEVYDGLGLIPHYDEDLDQEKRRDSRSGRGAPAADRRGRRTARGHARVQRLDDRGAEERHRLGRPPGIAAAGSETRPSPSPARQQVSTARSGRSRTCAGFSESPVLASSPATFRCLARTRRSTSRGALASPLVAERLRNHLAALVHEAAPLTVAA